MTKFGFSQSIHAQLREVFQQYPSVQQVILYGSRARGDFHDGSDIDLAVIAPEMDKSTFTCLWNEVDDLPFIFRIDLLHFDQCKNQGLIDNIRKDGVCFYQANV